MSIELFINEQFNDWIVYLFQVVKQQMSLLHVFSRVLETVSVVDSTHLMTGTVVDSTRLMTVHLQHLM